MLLLTPTPCKWVLWHMYRLTVVAIWAWELDWQEVELPSVPFPRWTVWSSVWLGGTASSQSRGIARSHQDPVQTMVLAQPRIPARLDKSVVLSWAAFALPHQLSTLLLSSSPPWSKTLNILRIILCGYCNCPDWSMVNIGCNKKRFHSTGKSFWLFSVNNKIRDRLIPAFFNSFC